MIEDRAALRKSLIEATEKAGLPVDMKMINKLLNETSPVVYGRDCGHPGKGYAVREGDWIFCDDCKRDSRVVKILASRGDKN